MLNLSTTLINVILVNLLLTYDYCDNSFVHDQITITSNKETCFQNSGLSASEFLEYIEDMFSITHNVVMYV